MKNISETGVLSVEQETEFHSAIVAFKESLAYKESLAFQKGK
jgi:hypothetical protein